MRLVLDVENTVTHRDGKLHLDPFESKNHLVQVGMLDADDPQATIFNSPELLRQKQPDFDKECQEKALELVCEYQQEKHIEHLQQSFCRLAIIQIGDHP